MSKIVRGVAETASNNATAFGFSLTIGGAGLILADLEGGPSVGETFVFIGGGSLAMILFSALASGLFRRTPADDLSERAAIRGSALNMLSVGAGLCAAWGLGRALDGLPAWGTGGLAAIAVYLFIEALEYAFVLRVQAADPGRTGDDDGPDPQP